MSSLFGVELPTAVNFVIAFIFVLLLIGLAAWLVRRFGTGGMDAALRGRQPRLAVIDSAAVDSRRKLVIIRRDNVEHLLMIGGPSDVVVETNIVRSSVAAPREAPARAAADTGPRPAPLPIPDPTPWPLQPDAAPGPAPARNLRHATDDVWASPVEPAAAQPAAPVPNQGATRTAEPSNAAPAPKPAASPAPNAPAHASGHGAGQAPEVRPPVRPTADALASLAEELSRAGVVESAAPRPTPAPVRSAPPVANPPAPAPEQNLADMAQRLEAALRRPTAQRVTLEGARVTATVEVRAARESTVREAPTIEAKPVHEAPKPTAAPPRPQPSPEIDQDMVREMATLLGKTGRT